MGYWDVFVDYFMFRQLRGCPAELFFTYAQIVLDNFSYFSLSYIMVIYLSNDFDYNDEEAGWIFGMQGLSLTISTIVLGFSSDFFGLRRTILLGNLLTMVARVTMAITISRPVLLLMLLGVESIGGSLNRPALLIAVQRFTSIDKRSVGFSACVVAMNFGAFIAAPVVEILRRSRNDQPAFEMGDMNGYRYILLVSAGVSGLSFILTFFVRDIYVSSNGTIKEFRPKYDKATHIMKEVCGSPVLWKDVLFTFLLIGVRVVERHLDATFPKYMIRTFGERVPFASILAVHSFLVILLVPAITPATRVLSSFRLIVIGSFITALSVLFMILKPKLVYSILFVVTLAIGQATWLPRLFEYSTNVAPAGREGLFMAVTTAPLILAGLAVGGLSGWLLTEYCPDTASSGNRQCDGFNMWLLVFLITCSSPLLLMLLEPWIVDSSASTADMDNEAREKLIKSPQPETPTDTPRAVS
eukprot:c965_g1_i2.p1 GENE.c965_g1_i2~~c965_g1_i2.p1  ORF type:complete len:470 (+),score=98.78 c965_g1_i2:31-1440(+)